MHGKKKVIVSIAGASSVIHGYAQEASIAVKTVTEPIAMKHGIVRGVRIALIMKPIYAEDAASVTAVRPSARNVVKNVQNVQTGFVMTAENVLNV